ncbi:MAG TPA: conjugal transfer protein [Candidatus Scatovicinus merdipullorum]|nr:conjugal transfer protein [Candidatus Scatovicinus merdipullorum]
MCPICGRKTHNKVRKDTDFPLYCPNCKQETLINAKDLQITVIQK